MIYTLDARSNVILQVARNIFKLNDAKCTKVILDEFKALNNKLNSKNINYDDLKSSLVPVHKDKQEIALIFDSNLISSNNYGHEVFEILLPAMNKESTYSVLCGDIILEKISRELSTEIIFENMTVIHPTKYVWPNQYYAVYINNLSRNQINNFISALTNVEYFVGYVDMTFSSRLKSILAYSLVHLGIKHKNTFLLSHPDDFDENENYNYSGFNFENHGFSIKSISEMYSCLFLSYKIESEFVETDDIKYSLNAIKQKPKFYRKASIVVPHKKLQYLKLEKAGIFEQLGIKDISPKDLEKIIRTRIDRLYIYNLEFIEQFNVPKFNISIELKKTDGKLRKVIVALKLNRRRKALELITMY